MGTRYIKLGNHLSSSPAFESGVIKIQNGREDDLTPIELIACRPLLKTNQDTEIFPRPNTISQIMAGRKRKITELKSNSKYEAGYILASAACVECHWSVADTILTKRRQSLSPVVSEALLFLKSNWEHVTESMIVEAIKINQLENKEKRTEERLNQMEADKNDIIINDNDLINVAE